MITENKIDEGIIPMNMGWRAGIGKETDGFAPNDYFPVNREYAQVNQRHNDEVIYDGGIQLHYVNSNEQINPFREAVSFPQLIDQIETEVNDVFLKYIGEYNNQTTAFKIKEDMKQTCLRIKHKYGYCLNQQFYDMLYNRCTNAYMNNFSQLPGVNALTEFVTADDKIEFNPLLIYQYFQL